MKRVPIKIRKAVHKDFCQCYNVRVFTADGVPQYIDASCMNLDSVGKFLLERQECTRVVLQYTGEYLNERIYTTLNTGLPVTVRTNRVLPEALIRALSLVPHSGIEVSINFLDDSIRNRLEKGASPINHLREMLGLAKSLKVFVALHVEYQPHLLSRLDLYEIIHMTKNVIGHLTITMPNIPDDVYQEVKTKWEALAPSSLDTFKRVYTPDVPTRTWCVRERYKQELISGLSDFIKSKKITAEVLGEQVGERVRHATTGMSSLPLGIRPFTYKKVDGRFVESPLVEETPCPSCGLTLLT